MERFTCDAIIINWMENKISRVNYKNVQRSDEYYNNILCSCPIAVLFIHEILSQIESVHLVLLTTTYS